jgi:endonuclease/exonuclease/phosphatase family metal-dependent hydrolase
VLTGSEREFLNTTIICIHTPTERKDEEQKGAFYELLERLYLKGPKHDIMIVMGDFNANMGKEHSFAPNVGQYSLHEEANDNGWRMIDFAVVRGMVVSSTLFHNKSIPLQMWSSPDSLSANQIDHVMFDSRHTTDIMDVRSHRGANCDSNHYMVKAKLRQRIAAIGKTKGQKILNITWIN